MSIIQRIQERQQSGVSEQVSAMDAEMVEANKPDAVQQSSQGREAHGEALRNVQAPENLQSEAASSEEQAVMTRAEQSMIQMVHGDGMTQKIITAVNKAQDPIHGIGTLSSDIVAQVKSQMPEATDDVLGALGERAIEEIVELVEIANPRLNLSEDDMAEAFSIGLQTYMQSDSVDVDEEELRGFIANG